MIGTYCKSNSAIPYLEPKVKKRGHGFTKALCKKAKQKHNSH